MSLKGPVGPGTRFYVERQVRQASTSGAERPRTDPDGFALGISAEIRECTLRAEEPMAEYLAEHPDVAALISRNDNTPDGKPDVAGAMRRLRENDRK